MDQRQTVFRSERGVALIIALLAILILTVLAAAIVVVTQTQVWTSYNYRLTTQSRYAAEAGLQTTMNFLQGNTTNGVTGYAAPTTFGSYNLNAYPVTYNGNPVILSAVSSPASNYPDATQQSNYNSALGGKSLTGLTNVSYSTYATLLSMTGGSSVSWLGGGGVVQTWQITSQGSVTGVSNAQVQVVGTYTRTGSPIFTDAAFAAGTACPALKFSAGSNTDSYNSSLGVYGAGNSSPTDGDIGSNGNITLSSSTVNGTASFGAGSVTTGACPNNYTNTGSTVQSTKALGGPVSYPNPAYTNPSPALTTKTTYSVSTTLPPGNYGNITQSGHTLTLSSGTYNFNSLALSGAVLAISITSGPVVIEIAGAAPAANLPTCIGWVAPPSNPTYCVLNFSGGASMTNPSEVAANVQFVYNGSYGLALSGGTTSAGVVYAPNAPAIISGGGAWYGSLVANALNDSGGSKIHYDTALQQSVQTVGPYIPVGFSWSTF